MVDATDSPVGMNGLFKGPEITSVSSAKSSPSKKVFSSES